MGNYNELNTNKKYKVLFVCLGNICRSPAAHGIFEHIVAQNGMSESIEIDSAGTYNGHQGELPDRRMRTAAAPRGYSLTHRSRPVNTMDFLDFDLIVAMDDNNYENLMVINMFRPLTRTPDQTVEVMREIEAAGNIPFTALVNNSNLGPLTSADDILRSLEYAEKISRLTGLEVKMTSVDARLFESLQDKVQDLFSLTLQPKIF